MHRQTLRGSERDRFLRRKAHNVVSPKDKDSLTPLGGTLIGPLSAICKWAETHLHQLLAARARRTCESGTAFMALNSPCKTSYSSTTVPSHSMAMPRFTD